MSQNIVYRLLFLNYILYFEFVLPTQLDYDLLSANAHTKKLFQTQQHLFNILATLGVSIKTDKSTDRRSSMCFNTI